VNPDALHIAFFNRAYYPESSATGQLLTELAEGLAQDYSCRVSVVTGLPAEHSDPQWTRPKGWGLAEREWRHDVEILRAKGTTFSKKRFWGRAINYFTYFISACWAGLRLKRPNVVVALTDPPIIGLAALLAARKSGARFIISYRDLFPEVGRMLEDFKSPLVDQVISQINQFQLRRADRIVALGKAMRQRLIQEKRAQEERVVVIPDWADTEQIQPGPKQNPFAKAHNLADCFVVMHAGNIGLTQNLDVLIEAAHLLRDLHDLTVVFIGNGIKKSALERQVSELGLTHVRFLPYQPKKIFSDVLASADCFIVSLKPGLAGYITPSKLYCILAAGRPYVAAVDEICDVARISQAHGCGLLARPGDAQDLAQKIRRLHEDRSLASKLGRKARQASSSYSRTVGIRAYHELCRSLA